jgi:hypothetical protein
VSAIRSTWKLADHTSFIRPRVGNDEGKIVVGLLATKGKHMKLTTIALASVLAISSSMALAAGAGGAAGGTSHAGAAAGAVGAGDAGSTVGSSMNNGTTNGNGRTQVNPPRSTIGPGGARTIPNTSGTGH